MEKQQDIMEAFYAEVKEREKYYWEFNLPLTDDLFILALKHKPELAQLPEHKRKELYMRSFFRVGEMSDFMMERILNGVEDEDINPAEMKVPQRNDIHEDEDTDFLYSCFDIAKKKLWICFPAMSEFSGNSLLYMNKMTYECVRKFVDCTKSIFD